MLYSNDANIRNFISKYKFILPEILEIVFYSIRVLNNHALDCPEPI